MMMMWQQFKRASLGRSASATGPGSRLICFGPVNSSNGMEEVLATRWSGGVMATFIIAPFLSWVWGG